MIHRTTRSARALPVTLGLLLGLCLTPWSDALLASGLASVVRITSPAAESTLQGPVLLTAAADAPGVTALQFRVNGAAVGAPITAGSCRTSWDTATVADGAYLVTAVSTDALGGTAESAPVTVHVRNAAAPAPPPPPAPAPPPPPPPAPAPPAAPVVSGLGVADVTTSSARITWTTDQASDSQLAYGPTSALGTLTALEPALVTQHTQVLSGLASGTTYSVRAQSRSAAGLGASTIASFSTAESPAGPAPTPPADPAPTPPPADPPPGTPPPGSDPPGNPQPPADPTPPPAPEPPTPPGAGPEPGEDPVNVAPGGGGRRAVRRTPHALEAVLVASGFQRPVGFVQHPVRPDVQLVVEQGGLVWLLEGGVATTVYVDLSGVVSADGERGLRGLAFAPDFDTSRRVFVSFTDDNGRTVISRFREFPGAVVLDPASRFDLVWPGGRAYITQPFDTNNGGSIVFGADGYLYVPLGDGGGIGDPANNAQNTASLLGKVLRLDVSVPDTDREGYDVPSDNPFVGQAGSLPEIWALGFRNPLHISVDDPASGGTGAVLVGDRGESQAEEINVISRAQAGQNYGWRNREGEAVRLDDTDPAGRPLVAPTWSYGRADGSAVTAGVVYRGTMLGPLNQGRYLFGDRHSNRIWSVVLAVDPLTGIASASDFREHTAGLGPAASAPSAFGVDASGEVYVVTETGEVYMLVPEGGPPRHRRR